MMSELGWAAMHVPLEMNVDVWSSKWCSMLVEVYVHMSLWWSSVMAVEVHFHVGWWTSEAMRLSMHVHLDMTSERWWWAWEAWHIHTLVGLNHGDDVVLLVSVTVSLVLVGSNCDTDEDEDAWDAADEACTTSLDMNCGAVVISLPLVGGR